MNVNYIGPLREQQGLSQADLGEKVGVTRQTIAVWERGERLPSLGQLARIADALKVSTDLFLRPPEDQSGPTLLFRADDMKLLGVHVIGDAAVAAPMPKSGFCASTQARQVAQHNLL